MLLLLVPKPRKVWRDGIRFMGRRYVDPTLAAFVGEQVEVLYDPRDLVEIHVYHDGRFVCRALCPEHVNATNLAAISRARRGVKQDLKQAIDTDEAPHDAEEKPIESRAGRRGGLKLYADDD
ncbi:MAG: Mu transposase C-terminal domain-containing protein [Salinisphaera sp.]|jgi:putative transposase|nr:Mu transposase C-terminal domain-containing protein [Salinisphaera sp.]